MHDPAFQSEYQKLKNDAWEVYKNIGRPWCPVAGDFVAFNRIGFQHLIRQKNMKRPRGEQRRRFALLAIAVKVIEDPTAVMQFHRKPTMRTMKANKEKKRVPSYADFWEFTVNGNGRTIKIIIRQFPAGQKHFLSVYEKKRKSPPL